MKKFLCSGSFGLALLCFCLPWISVSCQQQKVMSATGIQIVSGMQVTEPGSGMFGPAKTHKVEPDVIGILTLVAAAAAFCFSLLGGRASGFPALIGVATAFALKMKLDQDILKQGQGLFQVNYEVGFIGFVALMVAGALAAFAFPDQQEDPLAAGKGDTASSHAASAMAPCGGASGGLGDQQVGAAVELAAGTSSASATLATQPAPTAPRAAARFCAQCGTAVADGGIFCSECGVRICPEA